MKRKEYKIAQLYSYCNEETVDITQQPIDDSVERGTVQTRHDSAGS